jgi:hypothetical protein
VLLDAIMLISDMGVVSADASEENAQNGEYESSPPHKASLSPHPSPLAALPCSSGTFLARPPVCCRSPHRPARRVGRRRGVAVLVGDGSVTGAGGRVSEGPSTLSKKPPSTLTCEPSDRLLRQMRAETGRAIDGVAGQGEFAGGL